MFQLGFQAAGEIFEHGKRWPREERYALIDQIRRSLRAVCANAAEAWRKQRYTSSFVSKLSDANAAETQVWLDFALHCGYIDADMHARLQAPHEEIAGGLVKMMSNPSTWCGPASLGKR